MKTQFNFSKISLAVVLFFSFLFTTNTNAQMTLLTDVSNHYGSHISCQGANDGWIRITPINAVGNVTFSWSNGDSVSQISDLGPGFYEVVVSDSLGSIITGIEILEPAPVQVTLQAPQTPFGYNLICNGDNKGRILTTGTGGTGKLLYAWSDGSFLVNRAGLAAGSYTVSVTDENACLATASVNLTEPTPVYVNVNLVSDASTTNSADGSATAVATGGQGGVFYLWDNAETTETAVQLTSGFHTLKAYDYYGCGARGQVTVGATATAPTTIFTQTSNNSGTISGGRRSNTQLRPAILNNDIKNEGVMIQNVENFQENQLLISDMMGNVRLRLQNVSSVNEINVNLEMGHYVAILTYRNENGEMESVTNQISIR